jgi:hypothetical protein
MLTLLLAVLGMVVMGLGLHFGLGFRIPSSIALSLLVGVGALAAVSYWIRKRVEALVNGIQTRITERGQAVRRKYEQRGGYGGNMRFLMEQARRDQDAILAEALESTGKLEPYRKWSLLLGRQINSLRVQFLFQMKKFEDVDRLLPKALLANSVLSCMKMCRQYQLGQEDALRKTYEIYRKRFKYDAALIYATYAWMLIRKKKIEEAIKVLLDGKKATEDEILEKNWEHLVNGRIGQFSNAGLGESWYALMLEEPKQPRPTVIRQARPGQKWRRR